ncbi:hypothetical protein EV05_0243 [Prochlorococcus sp. MIT 0601]|nr:hypothetical protein EV05_0243 [Prochlorococcus sp. MIT 0601]
MEAYAHNHLKNLFQKDSFDWPHNLTLSRLIGRSLRRKDKSYIQLQIGELENSWLGVLVPLCLNSKGIVLVLTERQRLRLLNFELPRLQREGLNLSIWESATPPTDSQLWLLDHRSFFEAYQNDHLKAKQLIIPEIEFFSSRLREVMSIKVSSSDWDTLRRAYPAASSALIEVYERLSKRLFTMVTAIDGTVRTDFNDFFALSDLLGVLGDSPTPWPDVLKATKKGWASWAELDHKLLDWYWHFQPLEPLEDLKKFFQETSYIMLSGFNQHDLLENQFRSLFGPFDVAVKLGGPSIQHHEPLQVFAPRRQPLPNTEYFAEYLLDQCRRLILGRQGLTIILLDDKFLLRQLTTELAAEFGKRVILESTAPESNGVICCHASWWLTYQEQLPAPDQLIIGLLPIPSLEIPLIAARVEAHKQRGQDWFRDLLLPELLNFFPQLVLPIRKCQGRLAILDGRIRSRSWGERIFKVLEPWTPLERLLPD